MKKAKFKYTKREIRTIQRDMKISGLIALCLSIIHIFFIINYFFSFVFKGVHIHLIIPFMTILINLLSLLLFIFHYRTLKNINKKKADK